MYFSYLNTLKFRIPQTWDGFLLSFHRIQKRAKQSVGGLVWWPASRQRAGGRRQSSAESGACVFLSWTPTFRSHFWPRVQGFRCLREIRLSVIDEFVPVSAGGSLWFPRTRSHWTEPSSETSGAGREKTIQVSYDFLKMFEANLSFFFSFWIAEVFISLRKYRSFIPTR